MGGRLTIVGAGGLWLCTLAGFTVLGGILLHRLRNPHPAPIAVAAAADAAAQGPSPPPPTLRWTGLLMPQVSLSLRPSGKEAKHTPQVTPGWPGLERFAPLALSQLSRQQTGRLICEKNNIAGNGGEQAKAEPVMMKRPMGRDADVDVGAAQLPPDVAVSWDKQIDPMAHLREVEEEEHAVVMDLPPPLW